MPHLHLSLQHGDDLILKRMKRRHSRADALRFVETVRRVRPDVVFGADVIAGFPTEDEAMFARSLSIVAEAGITFLHVFPFSPRPGTPAARMPQVDRGHRQGSRRAAPRGGGRGARPPPRGGAGRDAARARRARRRWPDGAFHADGNRLRPAGGCGRGPRHRPHRPRPPCRGGVTDRLHPMNGQPISRSFPRKRESSFCRSPARRELRIRPYVAPSTNWFPACAGMSGLWSAVIPVAESHQRNG